MSEKSIMGSSAELAALSVLVLLQLIATWNSWISTRNSRKSIEVAQETHKVVNSRIDEWKDEQAGILKRLVAEAFAKGELSGRSLGDKKS